MAALPYMQLYVADYLADTAHLSAAEHGAYLLLIMNYWQRGKPLPAADDRLARICRMNADEWDAVRDNVREFFTERDGLLYHKRVEEELAAVMDKSDQARNAGRISAAKRRLNDCSTDVQRSFNHAEADTDTEADTDAKQKTTAALTDPHKYAAETHLRTLCAKYDPSLTEELDRTPPPDYIQTLVNIAQFKVGRNMVNGVTAWEAAEKALEWMQRDKFWRKHASVLWLLDVKNGGQQALVKIKERSQEALQTDAAGERIMQEYQEHFAKMKGHGS